MDTIIAVLFFVLVDVVVICAIVAWLNRINWERAEEQGMLEAEIRHSRWISNLNSVIRNQQKEYDKQVKINKELKEKKGQILGSLRKLRREVFKPQEVYSDCYACFLDRNGVCPDCEDAVAGAKPDKKETVGDCYDCMMEKDECRCEDPECECDKFPEEDCNEDSDSRLP